MEIDQKKRTRDELVAKLVQRDGLACQFPGASHMLDLSVKDGPMEPTIDHWFPQSHAKIAGWTPDEIWDIDNLKLMCKNHNAAKGDRIPNADGTLPPKPQSTFRFRRQKRANRPELCGACDNGHDLFAGEVCAACGCDAQRYPRSAFAKTYECDHALFWCPWCSIGVIPRVGATEMILLGGEGGDE